MAPATKLTPATEPATPLERLHADRAGLTSELAGLNASAASLNQSVASDAAVRAELDALSNAEINAMLKWSEGCHGEAPRPDQQARIRLAQKLNAIQAGSNAAKGAVVVIDQQIAALNERLRAIDAQIEQAALDAMQATLTDIRAEHLAAIELVRKSSAKLLGACSYMTNVGRRMIDHGDVEGGKRYLAKAEAMNAIKLPTVGVTQGEIIEAANDWSRRISKHRAGA